MNIFIKPGIYFEKVIVPSWKTRISLIGLTLDPSEVIIRGDDHTGKPLPGEGCWDPTGSGLYKTFTSYTVLAQGNEFQAVNLTIENFAGRVGQAVALHVEGDRSIIRNCRLLGNQDTLYASVQDSRQYYVDNAIEGMKFTSYLGRRPPCLTGAQSKALRIPTSTSQPHPRLLINATVSYFATAVSLLTQKRPEFIWADPGVRTHAQCS